MEDAFKLITDYVKSQQPLMVETLSAWCNINSGSENLEGLSAFLTVLKKAFSPIADSIDIHAFPEIMHLDISGRPLMHPYGSGLFIQKRPHLKRRVLLCGHMDTVYGPNHPFQTVTLLDKNTMTGPGVADMKGGLVILLHALQAFEKTASAETLGIDVFINADEELGSPASTPFIESIRSRYQAALVYEPAMDASGTLAKNRKGSGKLTLIATGKSAHAGRAFFEGRNAILYLSEALCAINALNGQQEGITINVGRIAGGEALNVVPDKAVAQLDVRISRPEDEFWVKRQLDDIIQRLQRPDFSLSVEGGFGRPVKLVSSGTAQLFTRLVKIGKPLSLSIDWKDSGGCCDGNNLSQQGLPVIDTLGARGGAIHSPEEFVLLDSLSERAALSALLLNDLAEGGLEELSL